MAADRRPAWLDGMPDAAFDVEVVGADDQPTGHIARVTVELVSYTSPASGNTSVDIRT